jgi:hypothetical protein
MHVEVHARLDVLPALQVDVLDALVDVLQLAVLHALVHVVADVLEVLLEDAPDVLVGAHHHVV